MASVREGAEVDPWPTATRAFQGGEASPCGHRFARLDCETCDHEAASRTRAGREASRTAAVHPHTTCPYCSTSITFNELWDWLMKNQSDACQVTAEKMMKAFTITKKGTV